MSPTDIETIRAFYVEARQQLYTYALSITGHREPAEDAIHGVFARLLQAHNLPIELRPYVFRAVRNAALDGRRRAGSRAESLFAYETESAPPMSNAPLPGGTADFDTLLDDVSPDEREAIVLKILSGLTFQEIAEMRDVPVPTVASWYRRGLERMRKRLDTEPT